MQKIPKKQVIVLLLSALLFMGIILVTNDTNMLGLSDHRFFKMTNRAADVSDGEESNKAGKGTKFWIRAKTMSDEEIHVFLKTTVIPEFKVDNVSLKDALKLLDEKIDEVRGEDSSRPKILLSPSRYIDDDGLLYEKSELSMSSVQIELLHVRNIPAAILLKYICDASRTRYKIHKGKIFIMSH